MKIKTSELADLALDWAVAKAEGALHPLGNVMLIDSKWLLITVGGDPDHGGSRVYFQPSTDWAQGGPIIERERIDVVRGNDLYFPKGNEKGDYYEKLWLASHKGGRKFHGPTPLIAAMRCYVANKLGDEAEVPDELIK